MSAPWEPTAWMREAIRRQIDQIEASGVNRAVCDVVVVPLTGSYAGIAGTREDRTCDRCRVYVPEGRQLWVGAVRSRRIDGTVALLAVGLCARCKDAEVGS